MFKKPFKIQNQNLMKNSDKKKFRDMISRRFPALQANDIDILIPLKGDVTIAKVSDSRMVLYIVDNDPIFIDMNGKNDFCPTVYALWKSPFILPIITIHPGVFKYIASGADLMLPGVVLPENIDVNQYFKKEERYSIVLQGTVAPVAVGTMIIDGKYIAHHGMKGKGLETLHNYKDMLWQMGTKSHPPNLTIVEKSESDDETNPENTPTDPETPQPENSAEISTTPENTPTDIPSEKQEINEPEIDHDALVSYIFMAAIKTKIKDKDLPILYNNFWSNYMLPCRPQEYIVDIKKTKYKKLSVLLKEMSEKGLITTVEANGVAHVTGIDRKHPDYIGFRPLKQQPVEENSQENSNEPKEIPLAIVELVKPPSGLIPMFADAGHSSDQLYSASEAKQVLGAYINKHMLSDLKDPKCAMMDTLLISNLFKNLKVGDSVEKKQINDTFMSKLLPYYEISKDGESEIRKGNVKPIQIQTEQRQGRKVVTKICGLETFYIDPDTLASECNKLFAASTTVQQLPGKNAGKEVLIQGNATRGVADHLAEKYNVPKKYIEITDKKK